MTNLASSRPRRIVEWSLTLLALLLALHLFSTVATAVEERPGALLADPLLAILPIVDLTWPIFFLIYGGILAAVVLLWRYPARILHLLRAYTLLLLVRCITLWITPLDPPTGMIVLNDPVAGLGPGGALTRDLFFSGHTATFVLLALAMPKRSLRIGFFVGCVVLAAMLLLQHVHYTVDVIAALFVAWGCWEVWGGEFAQ